MRPRGRRRLLGGFVLALAAAWSACSPAPGLRSDPQGRTQAPTLVGESAEQWSLHLKGRWEGAAWGLGPWIEVEAWIRADRWLRADLRFEDENGRPGHEVLVWGPDSAILFDRRKGRFVELADEPGCVDFHGGSFRARHVLWLLLGRWLGEDAPWGRMDGKLWSARDGGFGLRGHIEAGRAVQTGLVWRGERLSARLGKWKTTRWGAIPREMQLEGTMLDAVVRGSWTVELIPALDDGFLDPLVPMKAGNPPAG